MRRQPILSLSLLFLLIRLAFGRPVTSGRLNPGDTSINQQFYAPAAAASENQPIDEEGLSLAGSIEVLRKFSLTIGALSNATNEDGAALKNATSSFSSTILSFSKSKTKTVAELVAETAAFLRTEYTKFISDTWNPDLRVLDGLPLMVLAQITPASPLSLVGCPRGMVAYDLTQCTHGVLGKTEIHGTCSASDATFSRSLLSCAVWTHAEAQLSCPTGYRIVHAPLARHFGPCASDDIQPATRRCDPPYELDPAAGDCVLRHFTAGYVGCRPGELLANHTCVVAYQERREVTCPKNFEPAYHAGEGTPECHKNITRPGTWNIFTQRPLCPPGFESSLVTFGPQDASNGTNGTNASNASSRISASSPLEDNPSQPAVECRQLLIVPPIKTACPNGTVPFLEHYRQAPQPHVNANWGKVVHTCVRVKRFPLSPACPSEDHTLWVSGAAAVLRHSMLKRALQSAVQKSHGEETPVVEFPGDEPLEELDAQALPSETSSSEPRRLQSLFSTAGPWRSPGTYAIPGVLGFPWDFMTAQMIDTDMAYRSNLPGSREGAGRTFAPSRFGGNRYGDRGYGYEPAAVDQQVNEADMGLGDYYGAGRYDASAWIPGAGGLTRSPGEIVRDEEAYAASTDASHTVPPPQKPAERNGLGEPLFVEESEDFDELIRDIRHSQRKGHSVIPPVGEPLVDVKLSQLADPDDVVTKLAAAFKGVDDWHIDWVSPYLTGELRVVCESRSRAQPYLSCDSGYKLRQDGSCKAVGFTDFQLMCPEGFALDQSLLDAWDGRKKKKNRVPLCAGLVPTATHYKCPRNIVAEDGGPKPTDTDLFFANQTGGPPPPPPPPPRKLFARQFFVKSSHHSTQDSSESEWRTFHTKRATCEREIAKTLKAAAETPQAQKDLLPRKEEQPPGMSREAAIWDLLLKAANLIPPGHAADELLGVSADRFPVSTYQSLDTRILDAAFALTVLESYQLLHGSKRDPEFHLENIRVIGKIAGWDPDEEQGKPRVVADPPLRLCYEIADLRPAWFAPSAAAILALYGPTFGGELLLKAENAAKDGGSAVFPLLPSPPLQTKPLRELFSAAGEDGKSENDTCAAAHGARAFVEALQSVEKTEPASFDYSAMALAADGASGALQEALKNHKEQLAKARSVFEIEDILMEQLEVEAKRQECQESTTPAPAALPSVERIGWDDLLRHYDVIMAAPQYENPGIRASSILAAKPAKQTPPVKPAGAAG